MKLSICTDVMADLAFTDMLDKCVKLGVEGIEKNLFKRWTGIRLSDD